MVPERLEAGSGALRADTVFAVVALEEGGKEGISVVDIRDAIPTELIGEAILESLKESFHAALGLRAISGDMLYPKAVEDSTDLSCDEDHSFELVREGNVLLSVRDEDTVLFRVGSSGDTVAREDLMENIEVTVDTFLGLERSSEDSAGGIVDGCMKRDASLTVAEPSMGRGIDLDELTGTGAASPWGMRLRLSWGLAGTLDASFTADSSDRASAEKDMVPFVQDLGDVRVVTTRIASEREIDDRVLDVLGGSVSGLTASITMDHERLAIHCNTSLKPFHMAFTEAGQFGCTLDSDVALKQRGNHPELGDLRTRHVDIHSSVHSDIFSEHFWGDNIPEQ